MDAQDSSTESVPRMKLPDRSQVDPNPKKIDDFIPPDHKARTVWLLVGQLDLSPLYTEIKAVEGHAGRPATDPRILAALWLYGTDEGISSARELAQRCYDCDPYKWLRGGVDVNYHTLSDFRTAHPEWLKEQVVTTIAAMRAEGLASLEVLGQDGMRVRASAGNDSFKREETLRQLLEEAEQRWDRLQGEFEQETGLSARQQAAQKRSAQERIGRLKQALEEVKKVAEAREKRKKGDGASARASITDPPARRMKMGDGGTRPAYNVEFVTDLNSLVIMGGGLDQRRQRRRSDGTDGTANRGGTRTIAEGRRVSRGRRLRHYGRRRKHGPTGGDGVRAAQRGGKAKAARERSVCSQARRHPEGGRVAAADGDCGSQRKIQATR